MIVAINRLIAKDKLPRSILEHREWFTELILSSFTQLSAELREPASSAARSSSRGACARAG